ncbi:MAG: rod shape-determining protein MreD [Spirochaetia bacterium]|jgi:rod shape-determining protein MreD|nr:rod shape-determining protein MreD [Spirochaetia bacterium]
MTTSIIASTAISSLLLFIQTTWLRNGLFWGVIPDLAFLLILWVAYNNKGPEGIIVAFLSGIVCDLLSSAPIGYSSFLYILPAYSVTFVRKILDMDTLILPVILGFSSTLLKGIASLILALIFRSDLVDSYSFADLRFWVEAALNGALAAPLFFLFKKLKYLLVTRKPSE